MEATPIATFIGYWVQFSNSREVMCRQASTTIIKCVWTDDSGMAVSHDISIHGLSLSSSSKKGNYSGNGVITWETGDKWTKLSKIFFATQF